MRPLNLFLLLLTGFCILFLHNPSYTLAQTEERRMVIPESPVFTFDRLKKTVIRCVVSTGRFFTYPGSFSVKIEGVPKLTDYSIVPVLFLFPKKAISQDRTYAVDLVFNKQIPAGTYKVIFEHRVSMVLIDTEVV